MKLLAIVPLFCILINYLVLLVATVVEERTRCTLSLEPSPLTWNEQSNDLKTSGYKIVIFTSRIRSCGK